MTTFQFVLASLACYRITILFARDEGPFKIFKRLRAVPRLGHLTGCPFCISLWIGLCIELAFYFSGITDLLMVCACQTLAMSAISLALDRIFTSDHQT